NDAQGDEQDLPPQALLLFLFAFALSAVITFLATLFAAGSIPVPGRFAATAAAAALGRTVGGFFRCCGVFGTALDRYFVLHADATRSCRCIRVVIIGRFAALGVAHIQVLHLGTGPGL